MKEHIETLAKKAAEAKTADEAMKYSQAANNIGNASYAVRDIENPPKSGDGMHGLARISS